MTLSERAQKGNYTKATGGAEAKTDAQLYYDTAQDILDNYQFRVYGDTGKVILYDDTKGIYIPDDGFLGQTIYAALGPQATVKAQREIKNFVTFARRILREETCGAVRFKQDDNGRTLGLMLHVCNGWLDLTTLELNPHTADIVSLATLPVEYDPKAIPREFIRILREALTREYCMLFIKTIGNLLIPDCRYEKITYCVGKGHNRKSTLLKAVLNGVIGKGNYSSVPPQAFAYDKFAGADLENMLANVVFDLQAHVIKDAGVLKTVVSGDPIRVQRKYGQPYTMRPIAKHIMIANDIPESTDKTHAYWRRQSVIPFYTTFEEDTTIEARLSTEAEKSGILNLMICGMRRLLQDGFSEMNVEKVKSLYEYNGLTVRDFQEQECIINVEDQSKENSTLGSRMQSAYLTFEEKKRGKPVDSKEADYLTRVLGEELKKQGVKKRAFGQRGQQKNYYVGIRLKKEALTGQATL